jgi:hypothetical protein
MHRTKVSIEEKVDKGTLLQRQLSLENGVMLRRYFMQCKPRNNIVTDALHELRRRISRRTRDMYEAFKRQPSAQLITDDEFLQHREQMATRIAKRLRANFATSSFTVEEAKFYIMMELTRPEVELHEFFSKGFYECEYCERIVRGRKVHVHGICEQCIVDWKAEKMS